MTARAGAKPAAQIGPSCHQEDPPEREERPAANRASSKSLAGDYSESTENLGTSAQVLR